MIWQTNKKVLLVKQTNKQTNKVLLVKQTNNIAEHCSGGGGNKRSHASLATAGEERITKQTEIKKYWRKKRKGQRSEYVLISMPFPGSFSELEMISLI